MSRLSNNDRRVLLRLARLALEAAVRGEAVTLPTDLPPSLLVRASAFVTLRKDASLRGCVGVLSPDEPIYKNVIEAAQGAALRDLRFPRVSCAELSGLEMEISVLSQCREVRLEEIQIGVHGLVVSAGSARGLLLPQVAAERHWTALCFVEETCRKAGLPPQAWQQGAKIECFTADVFSERAVAA